MKRAMLPMLMSIALLAACSNDSADTAEMTESAADAVDVPTMPSATKPSTVSSAATVKPSSPIEISYRIIGQPIVGQPVAIDLQFASMLGPRSFNIDYRVNDATALQMPEAQALKVIVSPTVGEGSGGRAAQQVRVIPLREGRLYLNVAATIDTDAGSFSSVTAVPIEVGPAVQQVEDIGTVSSDENGELIRTLPARTD
jgi:hypothetical protein